MFVIKTLLVAILPLLALGHDRLCTNGYGEALSTKPFRIVGDCFSFHQCSNGHLSKQSCAIGTVFNPELRVCDWPANVPGCEIFTVLACENDLNVKASCPAGTMIVVKDGFYGRDEGSSCPHPSIQTTKCSADGSLEILKKSCNGKNSCTLEPANSVFGDPCVNTYKFIKMNYYCKKFSLPWKKATICEGQSQTLSCPAGKVIWVKKGYYGRDDGTTCPHKSIKTTTCAADESLKTLRSSCNGKNTCTVQSSNSVFGDPCVGTYKYVEMVYICHKKRTPKNACVDANGNPKSTGPFNKPNDCHNFYQCSNGILHVMPCGPGTVYNRKFRVCDHPQNVPGCH